ncbi:hypothetical protein AN958_03576 [Leucoagaricus sp. SymC.cos]|nr:hypothetical protein AN958_03576 [Leucoagaricus sp. SymC.cos]
MTEGLNDPSSSSSPAPSSSSTLVSTSPSSANWHAIRPWLPPLSLSVKEVTSVSVTFLLSATITPPPDLDIDIDLEAELENADENDQPHPSIISEALAKGLSVKVNGSPWQRVIIRIDDSVDEAVIIIYGLMPGRQYDIDLGLVQTRHLRRQVMTEDQDSEPPSPDSPSVAAITPVIANSAGTAAPSNTGISPSSQPSSAPNDATANPPAPPFTIEDRLAQLNHTLSHITSERESLQSQIKSVRREGQKADSALRSEIEILKRSSEKNSSAESRAKQKILALQEAVKRAQAGAKATEEQLAELEGSLPELLKEKEKKEAEHGKVKKDVERVRKEREAVDEKDRKRLEKLRTELSTLTHKLEKATGKKEKIEGTVLPELEEQLKLTRKELESVEEEEEELAVEELATSSGLGAVVSGQDYSFYRRQRANTGGSSLSNPGPISRPSRISTDNTSSPSASSPWNRTLPITGPGALDTSRIPQQPQSHRQNSLRSSTGSASSGGGSGSGIYQYPPGFVPLPYDTLSLHSQSFPQSHPQRHAKSHSHSTTTSSPSSSSSNSPVGPNPPHSLSGGNIGNTTTSPLTSRTMAAFDSLSSHHQQQSTGFRGTPISVSTLGPPMSTTYVAPIQRPAVTSSTTGTTTMTTNGIGVNGNGKRAKSGSGSGSRHA